MKKLVAMVVVVLGAACNVGPSAGQNEGSLDSLQCPSGQIPFNLDLPRTVDSSESMARSGDAGMVQRTLPKQNVVQIESATCNGNTDWTGVFKESCEGRTGCAFSRTDCKGEVLVNRYGYQGPVQVIYHCGDTPNDRRRQTCTPPLQTCTFQISCDQPAPSVSSPAPAPRLACVPANCNVAERRDENMNCVSDLARPTEYRSGYDPKSQMSVAINPLAVTGVYPSVAVWRGSTTLNLDTESVPWFTMENGWYAHNLKEADLPRYGVLMSEALYDVSGAFFYPVPDGTPNKTPAGAVSLWLWDTYKNKVNGQTYQAFRCVLHTLDLSKYGAGTQVNQPGYAPELYSIPFTERVLIPKDCRKDSAAFYESQLIIANKLGLSAVDFENQYTLARTTVGASYDIANSVILVDRPDIDKKTLCGPNPSEFFYSADGKAYDRYQYFLQRQIGMSFSPSPKVVGFDDAAWKMADSLVNSLFIVQEANLTSIGVSDVRSKQLAAKVRAVGPARGFLREDVDWYLAGDRHNYWQRTGFRDKPVNIQSWLVPLNSDDSPRPESDQLDLGTQYLGEGSPWGTTLSLKFPITEDLRSQFLKPGGTFEASKAGTKFRFRTCLKMGDGSLDWYDAGQYFIQTTARDKCRTSAPFLVKVDHAVEPVEPFSGDELAEAQPSSSGDGRASQQFDNDQSSACAVADGGVEICKTGGAIGQEGQGSFGGSMLKADNAGFMEGTNKAVVDKQVEMGGFEVLDDEEEGVFSGPGSKVAISVSPDWDSIAELLHREIPAMEFEGETYSGGVKGLFMGIKREIPVHAGALQGDVIIEAGIGVGLEIIFEYTLTPSTAAGCTANDGDCATLYSLLSSDSFQGVTDTCYAMGGRLAELGDSTEAGFLKQNMPASSQVWIGAQVANQYAVPACLRAWVPGFCDPGHQSFLRWLSNDEDFGSATNFGQVTADTTFFPDAASYTFKSLAGTSTQASGVVLNTSNVLEVRPMSEAHQAVCKFRNSASVTTHEAKASVEVVAAAGVSIAFCTPSEDFGLCLEGSLNIIEAKVVPSLTYTHSNFKDTAGRRGTQSEFVISVDYEVNVLNGEVAVKVVLTPWFSFKYTLFEYAGLHVPLGGNLFEKKYPMKEDFQ